MRKINRRSRKSNEKNRVSLSDAELQVFRAFPSGRLVKIESGEKDGIPLDRRTWDPSQSIRAGFLVSLLCGAVESEPGLVCAVNVEGACIVGELGFPEVRFKHRLRLKSCYIPDGINLEEATTRTLLLDDCHIAAMYLLGANIDGSMILSGARVGGAGRRSIAADRLTITGNIFCDKGFQAHGEFGLAGASVGGQLVFRGAHLDGSGEAALAADGLKVTDAMFCDEGFRSKGEVRLVGANIGGQLHLSAGHFDGNTQPAITADGISVADAVVSKRGFKADGQVRINDAYIGGGLEFSGAKLDGKGKSALVADRARVIGNALFNEEFRASGEVRLAGANIGSQLNFSGALLEQRDGPALTAEWLSVTGNMYCNEGFQALGELNLSTATIEGQLILSGAHLDGNGDTALHAPGLTVKRGMFVDEGFRSDGEVDLTDAKISSLIDETESWPEILQLDGLIYEDLTSMPARKRLEWLGRCVDYSPQPYEQLAAYYRRLGHDDEARRVLLAKLRRQRRQRAWWKRSWGWLQDMLAGYGYAPGRAILLLAGAFVFGWLVFSFRHPVPVGPGPHPDFNAALYTLDVLIPAPALGQADDFDPQGATLALAAGLHVLGWLLAITVIAAITRSFSRT